MFTDEEIAPFPSVKAWVDRIAARPAVAAGISADKWVPKD